LTILLEGFIEFLVAAYLNLYNNDAIETTSGEVVAKYLIVSALPLLLVALPIVQIWFIFQKPEDIEKDEFRRVWGPIFENVKTKRKKDRAFKLFYVIRRVIFVSVAFLTSTAVFQIGGAQFVNLAFIIYAAGIRPLDRKFMNRLEVFNEATVTLCTLHMALFTDYVPDPYM